MSMIVGQITRFGWTFDLNISGLTQDLKSNFEQADAVPCWGNERSGLCRVADENGYI